MGHWVETEMGACQRHDARHATRLAHVGGRRRETPVPRLPSAGHGGAETVAAYRFLENPAVGEQAMRSGHHHATLERIRTQDVVWGVHDTTVLDDGTTQPKTGMGTVQVKVRAAYRRHPPVALTPERMHRGVLGRKRWPRPEPPVAQERPRKPLEAQERYRWLDGEQLACEVQQRCPETRVVTVADREGEGHAWLLEALPRLPGARAACIIRAQGHRRRAKGQEPRDVWEARRKARAAGRMTIAWTRQPARPPCQVTRRIAGKRVTCTGVRRPGGRPPPVEVVAVSATECRPPRSAEPVAWLWLTSLPVAACPSACTVVPWYRCRWAIDLLFRVLKPGGQMEPGRVPTAQRLLNARARYRMRAGRSHHITVAGRAYPHAPCDVVFAPWEWHTIDPMPQHRPPPQAPPSLRERVRDLAQLGGV